MSRLSVLRSDSNYKIKINFDGGDLSSDAGLLLIKEYICKIGFDKVPSLSAPMTTRETSDRYRPVEVAENRIQNGALSTDILHSSFVAGALSRKHSINP